MFHYNAKFALILTIFVFCSTIAQTNTNCTRSCGQHSLQYPFGFSSGCKLKLNCSNDNIKIKIGEFEVQNITSDSILVSLPVKCNRSMGIVDPLFGVNFAPTFNNSFLLQGCKSKLNGCDIPPSSFVGEHNPVEGCGRKNESEDFICFTQLQRNSSREDVLAQRDLKGSGCSFLFSALAYDKSKGKELLLQLQMLELGWWLKGSCNCSNNASCSKIKLAGGEQGYRCQCHQGFVGDGFKDGDGCRSSESHSITPLCFGQPVPPQCKASTLRSGGCRKAIKIGVLVGGIIIATTVVVALSLLCYFTRRRSSWLRKQLTVKRLLREAGGDSTVPLYPYKEIERATSFFDEKHRLGTGAFGTVYAGHLHNDDESPKLSAPPRLLHRRGEQILVYEFMPNGTLSQHLQRERGGALPWTVRLTIATETANAIAYLHSAINPPIYHRDIKSSNILLDYSFQSKVADFGLSRLGMSETSHISTAPQGTPGYVDPQYHQNFHLSDKSDVYSFGVVLVEIITAMKVVDFSRPKSEINLAALAVERIRRACLDEIIDPFLEPHRDAWTLYSVHKVSELAFRCLSFHSDMRPTMIEVAEELELLRRSEWENLEETICTASSVGSVCSSPRIRRENSVVGVSFERVPGQGSEILIVPPKTELFLQSMKEVKDSSPVSVHDAWLSGTSSPSTIAS
ncbi:hypothetical protein ACSQ67_007655 [Phaseolus vulgaris]